MKDKNIAIILAAGKGSRMNSTLPKPFHEVAGRPIINHILDNLNSAGFKETIIVINKEHWSFFRDLKSKGMSINIAFQEHQLGTGDAVKSGLADYDLSGVDNVLVVFGDTPMLSNETFEKLISSNIQNNLTVLGFTTSDPGRYGRLITKDQSLLKIVEALDANDDQKKITLCNGGVMIVKAKNLKENLSLLTDNNAKKELILSDLVEITNNIGGKSSYLDCNYEETLGVDTKKGLSKAEKIFQNKLRDTFLDNGTTMLDPDTVFFSWDTSIGKDVAIGANVVFGKNVVIEDNVKIHSFCSIESSIIREGASIGPFGRLRNNAEIGQDSKIGNFVEVKNSSLKKGVKASHLSYIGDAEIDDDTNIGAGTITCNYDGVDKHKTLIGKRAFIGSNSSLIAPIKIGDGANVAAGSSISKDVEPGSLAITRSPIKFISNWSKKLKKSNNEEEKCAE
jgi:bifunctional UDP-N-acetylglucosamine pyrophosphorylase/glucosamine-1-phosphate N-acetyltransferase